MDVSFLQVFLLINVFLVGILVAIATRHAYAHFKPHRDADKLHQHTQGTRLPPAVREKLLQAAADQFQSVLDLSAKELRHDMKTTAAELNKQLDKLGTDIVNDEMQRYRASLDELRKYSETALHTANDKIDTHQAELEAKLAERRAELETKLGEEMAAEKQQLIQHIDTKLADAVASFLVEALQHDVDLGAQSKYLVGLLEEHKDDFKREVADES